MKGAQLEIPGLRDIGVTLAGIVEYPWGRGPNRPSKQYLTVSGKQPHGGSIVEALRETAESLDVKILYNFVVTRLLTNGRISYRRNCTKSGGWEATSVRDPKL